VSASHLQPAAVALTVNGSSLELDAGTTVAMLVRDWSVTCAGVAVAVNAEVVPRSEWAETVLCDRDRVEIVSAAAGG
jgi:sulfur carrier protein